MHDFANARLLYVNLPPHMLLEMAIERQEGRLTNTNAFAVVTAPHTGRVAQDKFIVDDEQTRDAVWWQDQGGPNRRFTQAQFDALRTRVIAHLEEREFFQRDASAVGSANIRLFTPKAWHAYFATNIFNPPIPDREIDITILHAPDFKADPARDGTRSDAFVILNFTEHMILIGGTHYAGEIKKCVFTLMNWLLPRRGVLPMHCGANMGASGDTALFFGLSGTGKTTLSTDPNRFLIGDDEHGWDDETVFNIEGGCYAKAINLSAEAEPEIYAAAEHGGTVLENVVVRDDGTVDYTDARYTENTRACYPLATLEAKMKLAPDARGTAPKNIFFLTCDAFGVLPPISKLTREQAMYHFLSGYTAKVAGTEQGLREPAATFSACFGAPFLPLPPKVYADLLGEKLAAGDINCWLLNTGWSGGGVGVGARMPLALTRALLNAALAGDLDKVDYKTEAFFGLAVPQAAPGIDAPLNPREAWADKEAYDKTARHLAGLFAENYKKFS